MYGVMVKTNKLLRVSIVIPVYNEADHITACLEAISRQTVAPLEVIVVDNNSSDGTAAIAQRYDFVQLLHQPRQGVVHARDMGFNAARGAIIGRIDADTVMTDNWVETLQTIFTDDAIGAVSGSARYHDMGLARIINRLDLWMRRYLAWALGREVAMQGANMAIRRSVWASIRQGLCRTAGMHEDFDVSIHANEYGYRVIFDESMIVALGGRQLEACFKDFVAYCMLSPRTYAIHGLKSHKRMYPMVALAVLGYLPLTMLHRGFDTATRRFSWTRLMQAGNPPRVNPGTFVE